jgi:hypothetical protein
MESDRIRDRWMADARASRQREAEERVSVSDPRAARLPNHHRVKTTAAKVRAIIAREAEDNPRTVDEVLGLQSPSPGAIPFATVDRRCGCEKPILLDLEGWGHMADIVPSMGVVSGRSLDVGDIKGGEASANRFAAYLRAATVAMLVPCRDCAGCRRWKRSLWTRRCKAEWTHSSLAGGKSYFATLTFAPDIHYRVTCLLEGRPEWKDATKEQRFCMRDQVAYPFVQKFLKRLRRGLKRLGFPGVKPRYIAVAEAHKTGLPHYHLVIHVDDVPKGFGKRAIEAAWEKSSREVKVPGLPDLPNRIGRPGWIKVKLARSEQVAGYMAKYMGKDQSSRVKASTGYGRRNRIYPMAHVLGHGVVPANPLLQGVDVLPGGGRGGFRECVSVVTRSALRCGQLPGCYSGNEFDTIVTFNSLSQKKERREDIDPQNTSLSFPHIVETERKEGSVIGTEQSWTGDG